MPKGRGRMDPSFTFEGGDSFPTDEAAPLAAWDLGDAIESAKAVKRKTKTFSTTDEKIRENKAKKAKTKGDGGAADAKKAKAKEEAPDSDEARNFYSKDSVNSADTRKAYSADKTFAELNLSRVLCKACSSLGFQNPTPIQVRRARKAPLSLSLSLPAARRRPWRSAA